MHLNAKKFYKKSNPSIFVVVGQASLSDEEQSNFSSLGMNLKPFPPDFPSPNVTPITLTESLLQVQDVY